MKHVIDLTIWIACFTGLHWALEPTCGDQTGRCTMAIMLCTTVYAKISIKLDRDSTPIITPFGRRFRRGG